MNHEDLDGRIRALELALEELSEKAGSLDAGEDPFAEAPVAAVTVEGDDPEALGKGLDMASDLMSGDKLKDLVPSAKEEDEDDDTWLEGDLDATDDQEMLDKLIMQRLRR